MKKLRIVLGAVLLAAMLIVFRYRRIAIYEDITLNAVESQDTLVLTPGDCLKQDMYLPYDYLDKISVALSYQEQIPQDTAVLVELTVDGETVMSQELRVNACANRSFLDFHAGLDKCEGKTVTISVSNVTPETVSGGEFALMSTDKDFLFLDTVSTCRINDKETDSCIFCRAVCIKGYSYYESVTGAFLVFLAGGVIMERLTGKRQDRL